MTGWRPPLALVLAWFALLALLVLTVTLAYVPLHAFNAVAALTIGTIKAAMSRPSSWSCGTAGQVPSCLPAPDCSGSAFCCGSG